VGWWQLVINEYDNEPAPPVKFSELGKSFLPSLFESAEKMII